MWYAFGKTPARAVNTVGIRKSLPTTRPIAPAFDEWAAIISGFIFLNAVLNC